MIFLSSFLSLTEITLLISSLPPCLEGFLEEDKGNLEEEDEGAGAVAFERAETWDWFEEDCFPAEGLLPRYSWMIFLTGRERWMVSWIQSLMIVRESRRLRFISRMGNPS